MEYILTFDNDDGILIERIEEYRQKKAISFQDAIKQLCAIALEKEALKWEEFK